MSRKHSFLIVKILLGLACFSFIAYKLKNQFSTENSAQLKTTFSDAANLQLLILTTFLLFLNWGLESFKWMLITAPIEKISYSRAYRSVLAGLCVGNLTPGRIGEFAGRIIFFSPGTRSKITVSHFVCGLSQLFITVAFGILAMICLLNSGNSEKEGLILVFLICGGLLISLLLLVMRINRAYAWLSGLKMMKRFELGKVTYSRPLMIQLLFFSAIRYLVFSVQYFLLLKITGMDADSFRIFCAIAVSFMLMSSIPMISFIEVAVRAAIAVMVFGQFQQNSLQLITASTLLWIINLVIPSVIGYVFLFREKIELGTFRKATTE